MTGALALHKMTLNAALDPVPPAPSRHRRMGRVGVWGVLAAVGLALGAATYCHWRRRGLPRIIATWSLG